MDYYDRKHMESESVLKVCFTCLRSIVILIFIAMLTGCKSWKHGITEKENTSESVRVEYREKIVKVPVVVEVEVPMEHKEKMTKDSTSHLETNFAVSDASIIWIDGVPFLRHSLDNKAQKIQKKDSVPVVYKDRTEWRTRRVTYNKTEIREKRLAWWQKGLMWAGGIFVAVLIIFILILLVRAFLKR